MIKSSRSLSRDILLCSTCFSIFRKYRSSVRSVLEYKVVQSMINHEWQRKSQVKQWTKKKERKSPKIWLSISRHLIAVDNKLLRFKDEGGLRRGRTCRFPIHTPFLTLLFFPCKNRGRIRIENRTREIDASIHLLLIVRNKVFMSRLPIDTREDS